MARRQGSLSLFLLLPLAVGIWVRVAWQKLIVPRPILNSPGWPFSDFLGLFTKKGIFRNYYHSISLRTDLPLVWPPTAHTNFV